jgi:MFS family permease
MAHHGTVSAPPILAGWISDRFVGRRNAAHTRTEVKSREGLLFRVSAVLAVVEAGLLLVLMVVLLHAVLPWSAAILIALAAGGAAAGALVTLWRRHRH